MRSTYVLTVTFEQRCGHMGRLTRYAERLTKLDRIVIRRMQRKNCDQCVKGGMLER